LLAGVELQTVVLSDGEQPIQRQVHVELVLETLDYFLVADGPVFVRVELVEQGLLFLVLVLPTGTPEQQVFEV